jgi:hypothetical protein
VGEMYFVEQSTDVTAHTTNFSITGLQVVIGKQLVSCRLLFLTSPDSNICNYCSSGHQNIAYVNNPHPVQEFQDKIQREFANIS